jgi:hypothetical protein
VAPDDARLLDRVALVFWAPPLVEPLPEAAVFFLPPAALVAPAADRGALPAGFAALRPAGAGLALRAALPCGVLAPAVFRPVLRAAVPGLGRAPAPLRAAAWRPAPAALADGVRLAPAVARLRAVVAAVRAAAFLAIWVCSSEVSGGVDLSP